jgi:hypothetical protein
MRCRNCKREIKEKVEFKHWFNENHKLIHGCFNCYLLWRKSLIKKPVSDDDIL